MSEPSVGDMKVVLLAPIEPFRSGIAKHSTQIALELSNRQNVDLYVMSFKRLYPAFLFPGESDKDHSNLSLKLKADFDLDTINPFTWQKTSNRIKALNPELVIIPAWTFFVAPCLGWIANSCRQAGIKVTCIVHNAFDHEGSAWKKSLMKYQLSKYDRFICHNQTSAKDIREVFSNADIGVSPHPIFDQYPKALGTLSRRAPLELLFFGIIREYKGLDILLDAVATLGDINFHLSIVGECWGDIKPYKVQAEKLGVSNKVEFLDTYASDADTAEYFSRSDVVVLPYRSMTGTGVIPLAYNYNRPVITTHLDAFHEVVEEGVTGIIASGVDSKSLAKAIIDFQQVRETTDFPKNTHNKIELYTWEKFCDVLL
jgi:glycosyltransferase involved in cell wall biosynthesis